MSPAPLEDVPGAVRAWVQGRARELGVRDLAPDADLFERGLLDSVGLTALVAHVEARAGCRIDFLEVDPDALGTVDGAATELLRVARPR